MVVEKCGRRRQGEAFPTQNDDITDGLEKK
jgi:hypothetical protein